MKTNRILLALFLPCLLVAATLRHQAFGPIKFGMLSTDAEREINRLYAQEAARHRQMDAADVRAKFVTSLVRHSPKLTAFDSATQIRITFPRSGAVSTLSVVTTGTSYDDLKKRWQVFQEIGDCKFSRIGKPIDFPTEEELKASTSDITTDTWEAEGISVKLKVHFTDLGAVSNPPQIYEAKLEASEIAPTAAK